MPKIKKDYFLVDLTRNSQQIKMMRMCEVAAMFLLYRHEKIDLKVEPRSLLAGIIGREDLVRKYWKWDKYPPSPSCIYQNIRLTNVKWFIRKHLEEQNNGLWTSDFLHGLIKCGGILSEKKGASEAEGFPTFEWYKNPGLVDIILACPFSGKLSERAITRNPVGYKRWLAVPALCMNYREDTGSFLAGVLATGEVVTRNGSTYVKYAPQLEKYLVKNGIPIEIKENPAKKVCHWLKGQNNACDLYISPVWAAVLSIYMPEICAKKFLGLKKGYLSELYSPILWRSYVSKNFVTNGLPYLKSRRAILYNFQCDEGALEKLDRLRVEKNLTILSNAVVNAVKAWAKKSEEKGKSGENSGKSGENSDESGERFENEDG